MRGVLALVLALGTAAGAAEQRPLALDEMVAAADEIVIGEVARSRARWQGRFIVTVSTVRVDETLKGAGRRTLEVAQLGGTAVHRRLGGPVSMSVSGQASLRPGETVLLFVEPERGGLRQLVGAEQGKLLVDDDSAGGTPTVRRRQLRVERERGRTTLGAEPVRLDEMRARIRALIAGGVR